MFHLSGSKPILGMLSRNKYVKHCVLGPSGEGLGRVRSAPVQLPLPAPRLATMMRHRDGTSYPGLLWEPYVVESRRNVIFIV